MTRTCWVNMLDAPNTASCPIENMLPFGHDLILATVAWNLRQLLQWSSPVFWRFWRSFLRWISTHNPDSRSFFLNRTRGRKKSINVINRSPYIIHTHSCWVCEALEQAAQATTACPKLWEGFDWRWFQRVAPSFEKTLTGGGFRGFLAQQCVAPCAGWIGWFIIKGFNLKVCPRPARRHHVLVWMPFERASTLTKFKGKIRQLSTLCGEEGPCLLTG